MSLVIRRNSPLGKGANHSWMEFSSDAEKMIPRPSLSQAVLFTAIHVRSVIGVTIPSSVETVAGLAFVPSILTLQANTFPSGDQDGAKDRNRSPPFLVAITRSAEPSEFEMISEFSPSPGPERTDAHFLPSREIEADPDLSSILFGGTLPSMGIS